MLGPLCLSAHWSSQKVHLLGDISLPSDHGGPSLAFLAITLEFFIELVTVLKYTTYLFV